MNEVNSFPTVQMYIHVPQWVIHSINTPLTYEWGEFISTSWCFKHCTRSTYI